MTDLRAAIESQVAKLREEAEASQHYLALTRCPDALEYNRYRVLTRCADDLERILKERAEPGSPPCVCDHEATLHILGVGKCMGMNNDVDECRCSRFRFPSVGDNPLIDEFREAAAKDYELAEQARRQNSPEVAAYHNGLLVALNYCADRLESSSALCPCSDCAKIRPFGKSAEGKGHLAEEIMRLVRFHESMTNKVNPELPAFVPTRELRAYLEGHQICGVCRAWIEANDTACNKCEQARWRTTVRDMGAPVDTPRQCHVCGAAIGQKDTACIKCGSSDEDEV